MTTLYLLEPPASLSWFPFSNCRPICELRAGAWLIRERWEAVVEGEAGGIFGTEHLHPFVEEGVPPVTERHSVSGPAVVGRSDFAPAGVKLDMADEPHRLVNDGATVGWCVPEGHTWEGEHAEWGEKEFDGVALHGAYDVVTALEHLLEPDAADFTHEASDPVPQGSIIIGDPSDVIILGAAIEPGTVFDVRHGVVVVEQHTHVKSGTGFVGPVYVGPGCEIHGGSITACSIGPRCKVRGEVAESVFVGYANKAHDGYVGHSVIGRWVNLGAGTTTSDLKNTYGPVRLKIDDTQVDTNRQFLGTLFGDHCKTAIGTMLSTGAAIGVGANVFGSAAPVKYVPPFAWGDAGGTMEREGFLKIAKRVMPRRQVEVTDQVQDMLLSLYDNSVA